MERRETGRDRAVVALGKFLRPPTLPPWWPLVQIGVVAVVVIAVIAAVGEPSPSSTQAFPDEQVEQTDGTTVPQPDSTTDEPGPSTSVEPSDTLPVTTPDPDVTDPPGDTTVEVLSLTGSTVSVPAAALDRARAIAEASNPGAVGASVVSTFSSPTRQVFTFTFTDGPSEVALPVVVDLVNGMWVSA